MNIDYDKLNLNSENNIITNINEFIDEVSNYKMNQELYGYLKILLNKIKYGEYENKDELVEYLVTILLRYDLNIKRNNIEMIDLLNEYYISYVKLINIDDVEYLVVDREDDASYIKALPIENFMYMFVKEYINNISFMDKEDFINEFDSYYKEMPKLKKYNLSVNVEYLNQFKEYIKKFNISGKLSIQIDCFGNSIYVVNDTIVKFKNDEFVLLQQGNLEEKEKVRNI